MTYLQDVTAIRDGIAAKLKALLALDELKPNYTVSGPEGSRTFGWAEYVAILRTQLREAHQDVINAGGPQENSVIGLS